MIRIREFRVEDVSNFNFTGDENGFVKPIEAVREALHHCGITKTVLDNIQPIIIIGCFEINSNTVNLWGLFDRQNVQKRLKKVISVLSEELSILKQKYQRIQAICYADIPSANKLCLFFKFNKEATLKKFTEDGKDINIYSIINERNNI